MIQISKVLKQVPIFRMLGKESIDFIVERLKFKTFDAAETICKIGDPGDEMYIIITGEVKICIYGDGGKTEQTVAKLGSGDYFGEMSLLTGDTRSASVIATEPCEMFILYKNDFDVILEKYPSISLSMGKIVSQRLRETLKKATLPDINKLEASKGGPSGSLKEISLVELISFCETNSLTGSMELKDNGQKGLFEFESGELVKVALGDIKDDKALDTMLSWTEGQFEIRVRPLTIEKKASQVAVKEEIKKILVVNNSLVVRKVIERAFNGLGYSVKSSQNIGESISLIDNEIPDVIISDIKLPDGDGLGFVEKARKDINIPFIFIADNSVKAEIEKEIRQLSDVELTKTHEVSEIVKLVENMI
ncbi:MAG: cyclic nucleotide-binding domain-containing protein [Calditrichaceae bacterium]